MSLSLAVQRVSLGAARFLAASLVSITAAAGGSESAVVPPRDACPAAPVKSERTIAVGGLVGSPGRISIPAGGLTLQQALVRAGAAATGTRLNGRSPRLVCRERNAQGRTSRLFFPLEFARAGVAGGLALQGDDRVTVVPFDRTRLGSAKANAAGAKTSFTVAGIVERPGKYERKPTAGAIVDVLTPEYAGALRVNDDEKTLLVLTRHESAKITERYYLPLFSPYLTRHFLMASLAHEDHLLYTRLGEAELFRQAAPPLP